MFLVGITKLMCDVIARSNAYFFAHCFVHMEPVTECL